MSSSFLDFIRTRPSEEDIKDFLAENPKADIQETNDEGCNALDIILNCPPNDHILSPYSYRMMTYFINNLPIKPTNNTLYIAASNGNTIAAAWTLDQGVKVDEIWGGFTPLFVACRNAGKHYLGNISYTVSTNGKEKELKTIEEKNKQEYGTGSPIHELYVQIIELLLSHNADVHFKLPDAQQNMLHHAADKNDSAVASILISKGIDINAQDVYGLTPLHFAVRCFGTKTVELLLKAGANPNIPENYGFTPLHEAVLICGESPAYYSTTEEDDKGIEYTVTKRPMDTGEGIIKLLLQYGAEKNKGLTKKYDVFEAGFTPLQMAQKKEFNEAITILQ